MDTLNNNREAILKTIGRTPLVPIRRLNPNPKVQLFAKLEYFNPSGSVKDRAALYMIEDGEASGVLTKDKTVIEATSGNTGIGLALVCAVKGYRLVLTMSEAVSKERQQILKARGAKILFTPAHLGTDGAIEEAYRLARENPNKFFLTDQFNNPANWRAHYETTANEIWEQTDGKVSAIVAAVGTSGTLMGIQRRFKEIAPTVEVIGIEPYLGHKIQGLKNMMESYQPEIFEKKRLDRKINVDDDSAYEMARRLAREEGLLVGMSSGAAMAGAYEVIETLEEGTVVVLLPDSGERYLSTALYQTPERSGMNLFNTLTGRKEPFTTLIPDKVHIYTCGPTVDAPLHVGQYRRYVFSDLLYRYLRSKKFALRHITNITDLDDKTIQGSQDAGVDIHEFTQNNIDRFKQDLDTLGIAPADRYPRTSNHVGDMVQLAEKLNEAGFAYEKLHSLYFNISRFDAYGGLSGVDMDKIRLGVTVDLDEYEKDNPRDFTLLKRAKLSELRRGICVSTRWGITRPSLHLQCAAMAMKHLGESFDIHTGGRELVFPHHENERAIAGALSKKPLANFWMHSEQVLMGNGRPPLLRDLLAKGYTGPEIRYWLLSSHYRKPLVFSDAALQNARRSLARLNRCIQRLKQPKNGLHDENIDQLLYDLKNGFTSSMDDDLNISNALSSIFKVVREVNRLDHLGRIDQPSATKILNRFRKINRVLNVFRLDDMDIDDSHQHLIKERYQARVQGDFEKADAIRERLKAMGVEVRDNKLV